MLRCAIPLIALLAAALAVGAARAQPAAAEQAAAEQLAAERAAAVAFEERLRNGWSSSMPPDDHCRSVQHR